MSYFANVKIRDKDDKDIQTIVTDEGELKVVLGGHAVPENSTSTPMLANEVYLGTARRVIDAAIIIVTAYSDVASAEDGLMVEWSMDGTNWDGSDTYTIPANKLKTFSFQPVAEYIRVRYTNGGTDQTQFRLQTIRKHSYTKPSSHRIQDSIIEDDDAELVKAVLTAKKPEDGFINIGATNNDNLRVSIQEYGDTPAVDAFDRLRVANPYTLFDSKQLHDKLPLFWDEAIGGSATSTHNAVNSCTEMRVTANAGDYVLRQTKQRFNYQPGKSMLFFMTFYSPQTAGVRCRVGPHSYVPGNPTQVDNGIYFECDGDLTWNIAKNGTITQTASQADWSIDKLDGSGRSGITLDMNAAQFAIVDYEWLGIGRVRVGFMINGVIYYVHTFKHANNPLIQSVYMSTPNLPISYFIQNETGANAGALDHICSTVISEGGVEKTGIQRSVDSDGTTMTATAANTTYALIAIRLKEAYDDITVIPENFSLKTGSKDIDFRWSLHFDPTLSAGLTWMDIPNSACQFALPTGVTVTDEGIKMDSGYTVGIGEGGTAGTSFKTNLRMGRDIDGTRDIMVLAVRAESAGAIFKGALTFRELL